MTALGHLNVYQAPAEQTANPDAVAKTLIARIAQRDKSALAAFYNQFSLRLFGYLYRLTNNRSLAEDILQEVMLVVWEKADCYRGESKVSSWVFGIAHNLALAALRRDQSGDWLEWDAVEAVESDTPALEENVIHLANTEAIMQALSELTPDHREVLELAFYQEFSCKEIAAIASVPEGTVKSRLSYARKTLKAILLRQREEL